MIRHFDVIINDDTGWQHFYYYFRWNGTSWKRRELVNGGASMGGESGFAGGTTLDHGNPNVIYRVKSRVYLKLKNGKPGTQKINGQQQR